MHFPDPERRTQQCVLVLSGSPYLRRRTTRALDGAVALTAVSSVRAALAELRVQDVDLVVLDSALPDLPRVLQSVLERRPGVLVVLHGTELTEDELLDALRRGAKGYLPGVLTEDALQRAVLAVLGGEVAIPRGLTARLVAGLSAPGAPPAWQARMTTREREVAAMLGAGATTAEISAALHVSPGTVRTHVAAVVRKLGVTDRDEAVALLGRVST